MIVIVDNVVRVLMEVTMRDSSHLYNGVYFPRGSC